VTEIGAKRATCIVMHARPASCWRWRRCVATTTTGEVEVTSGNFAAVDADEPGSVAKVITVAAALNEGAVTPDTGFEVPWREQYYDDLLSDAWQHPDEWMTVEDILVTSSNIGTIKIWERIGRERTGSTCERSASASDGARLPGRVARHPEALDRPVGLRARDGELRPGLLEHVDPARHGRQRDRQRRHLRRAEAGARHGRPTGEVTEMRRRPPTRWSRPRPPDGAAACCRVGVRGTGRHAQVEGFSVAGKTGTGLKAQADGTYLDARAACTTRASSGSSRPRTRRSRS
jgi:cell division protein FtsI (penicillin-binding protein 3)